MAEERPKCHVVSSYVNTQYDDFWCPFTDLVQFPEFVTSASPLFYFPTTWLSEMPHLLLHNYYDLKKKEKKKKLLVQVLFANLVTAHI